MLAYHIIRGNGRILKLFICFCILLWCKEPNCWGQNQTDTLKIIRVSKNDLILDKNDLKRLPILNLSENKIGFVKSNQFNDHNFFKTLEKYTRIEHFNLSKWNNQQFNSWLRSKEIVIIGLDKQTLNDNDFLIWYDSILKNSPKLLEKIIAVFFQEESIELQQELTFFTSIYLTNNERNSSLAAQSIFGAIPLYNDKGVKQTQGNLRLGYSTPEMVNMDGALLNNKIDSIVNFSIEKGAFPGAQILVAKIGKVIFHKSYGFHTYEKVNKVELNDIYDFASVSKITTALPALMKLHGEGKFKLDQPFKTYFPKFKKSNKADLTYREILAHQAGLRPWIPYWKNTIKENGKFKRRTFKNNYSRRYNVKVTDQLYLHRKYKKKIYKAIYDTPVSSEKKYKYSGLVFYLFPEIIKDLTQTDFESYLKSTFYEPLGAMSLTYNPLRFFPKEQIIQTERDTFFRKIQIHGTVHDEGAIMMGGVSANAGLFGNANDLAKLMQMYLNEGTYGGKRFIAKESIQEFTKYQYPENENRRGLGFDKPLLEYDPIKSSVAKDASPSSYGHSGYTGTFVWVDPDEELIYIFFSNRVFPTRNNRKIYQLNIRPSIHQVIYDAIKNTN